MAKKDFTELETGRALHNTIAEATAAQEEREKQEKARKARREYTAAERQEFIKAMKTAGRKGVKLPRINLAFSPDIYDYVQTMARVRGETLTEFVNLALRQYMADHMDVYEKAIEFRNSL